MPSNSMKVDTKQAFLLYYSCLKESYSLYLTDKTLMKKSVKNVFDYPGAYLGCPENLLFIV